MSFTVDANILVHASNDDAPERDRARTIVQGMLQGPALSTVFWSVLAAYLRIVTHPRILPRPFHPERAMTAVDTLVAAPSVRVVGEGEMLWAAYRSLDIGTPIRGNDVSDAMIVAQMITHGVSTIYSRDGGFRRFDGIRVIDPFN